MEKFKRPAISVFGNVRLLRHSGIDSDVSDAANHKKSVRSVVTLIKYSQKLSAGFGSARAPRAVILCSNSIETIRYLLVGYCMRQMKQGFGFVRFSTPCIILASLPSFCQKLSKLVDI